MRGSSGYLYHLPLTISDELLERAELTEKEARVEIACRLFDAEILSLPMAGKWAGLERVEMESELAGREIPLYRLHADDLEQELETLRKLG